MTKPTYEELERQVAVLRKSLQELITHGMECEKELDEFHGLGGDAGSGCSVNICNAQQALSDTSGTAEWFVAGVQAQARADLVPLLIAIGERSLFNLLEHLRNRRKEGEMYFANVEHVTGVMESGKDGE